MKEFNFKEKKRNDGMSLKIGDAIFNFNPLSAKVISASKVYLNENAKLQEDIDIAKNDTVLSDEEKLKKIDKLNLEACESIARTVDGILGNGAYEKIFNDRTVDYDEHTEVVCFIFENLEEYGKAIVDERTTN